ncbi:MAG TPA: SDR family oxidoreductase, partial [Candidatus Sulfotelmatobacter sp.]|nr:SDR family oxidoreductase [Candidatus Sulfotelmatobacter sp.]
ATAEDIRGESIVITGASGGFGSVTTSHLLRRGWTVIATVRGAEAQQRLREETAGIARDRLLLVECDITQESDVAHLAETVAARELTLGALVNNAGTAYPGPVELLDREVLREQFEVNVFGTVAVTQALLPALRASRGRIINVSSVSSQAILPLFGAYSASKAALEALSDALRGELEPFGVSVSVIRPAPSPTGIWEKGLANGRSMLQRHLSGPYSSIIRKAMAAAPRLVSSGFPPQVFAEAIEDLLTTSAPPAYLTVPRGWGLGLELHSRLPARAKDWIARSLFW